MSTIKIEEVLLARGLGGFFNDDQVAIREGASRDSEVYVGTPMTKGFEAIRVPAQSMSVGLVLSDSYVAWGDMMSVQYAAVSGRDPLFKSDEIAKFLQNKLIPAIAGREVDSFCNNATFLTDYRVEGEPLHAGVQYGLSQAFLQGAAHAAGVTMAEQICAEYNFPLIPKPVPIYAQSGDQRKSNVDKMILKGVDVLPHGLINSLEKFGEKGEVFLSYVEWVVQRIKSLRRDNYQPVLYFDVYGMPGIAFNNDIGRIADYLATLEKLATPFTLRIESPVNFGSAEAQVEGFACIKCRLKELGSAVEISVDEWCNNLDDIDRFIAAGAADLLQIKMPDMGGIEKSIEAVKRCRAASVGAYLGGSCTETDLSARVSMHVAVATQADMFLAKPGMGVDEAVMIVGNEQARLLSQLDLKKLKEGA